MAELQHFKSLELLSVWITHCSGCIGLITCACCFFLASWHPTARLDMNYVSLMWRDSIPHIKKLLQVVIALHKRDVATCVQLLVICQCSNHWKTVIISWLFNCLITFEDKCQLCKCSNFIMHFITCMLKHIKCKCLLG